MIQAVLWGFIKKQSQNNELFVFDNSLDEENKNGEEGRHPTN